QRRVVLSDRRTYRGVRGSRLGLRTFCSRVRDHRPGSPKEAHVTGDMGLSDAVGDTDPPCSPRAKWSLAATTGVPGGLDRAGGTSRLTNGRPSAIPARGRIFRAAFSPAAGPERPGSPARRAPPRPP